MLCTRARLAFLASASLISLSGQAMAQDAASTAPTDGELADIVVTGSRVIKNGDASPSPVTVVSTSDLLAVQPGTNLADALNTLPVFAGSRGAGSNPSTAGSASGGNGAANQLNLRNVGITRTLVLMDGLRIPPTLFNGAVDVDLVPQALIQRVDVVTGGVSAVYGSDAVSGVVNYVINKNFNGLMASGSGGISEYGDARQIELGAAYGSKVGDNGHFEASYQYRESGGVLRRSDRPWMNLVGIGGAGTAASPYNLFTNIRQAQYPAGGRILSGTLANQTFKTNGVLSPFVSGSATGSTAFQVGGDGGTWDSSLLQPYNAHQAFARYDHQLSDTMKAYVQLAGNFKKNWMYAEYARIDYGSTGATMRGDNPFLSQSIRSQLAPGSTFLYRQTLSDGTDTRQYTVSDSGQWVATAGLEGSLFGADWQINYVHGQTLLRTKVSNNLNQQRLAAALDAVDVGGGVIKCYAATQAATAAAYANCVPLNPFGPTAASNTAGAYDYIFGTTNYRALTKMDDISGNVSASPFSTWAGDVNMALSAEWRRLAFKAKSDATAQDFVNCTGLRYNCNSGQTQYFVTLPNQFRTSQTVWEVAGEVNVPLLKDSAVGSFSVNGAARYTRYNTSGNYTTWKVGADWELFDGLRFRGTISRDIRAPTLYELYSEPFFVNVTANDRLPGSTAGNPVVPSINVSNPNLTAETAKTITGGVVWKPIPQLSIALDGYQIQIDNAIQQINGGDDFVQAACYASANYSSPFCSLQTRAAGNFVASSTNSITAVYSKLFNIAQTKTWGADLEVNFNSSLFGRAFNARVLAAYQPHLWFRQPGVTPRDQAGAAFGPTGFAATPTVRLTGFVRFKPTDRLTVDIMERWRNAMKLSNDGVWVAGANRMAPFATTNINLTWAVDGGYEFFVNVQNLLNAVPPIGGFTGNGNRAGLRDGYAVGDDVRGRFYTAGFRIKM